MVTIQNPHLSIGARSYVVSAAGAVFAPTALSGASVSTGAESCASHAEPGAFKCQLWLPDGWAGYLPAVNEPVALTKYGAGLFYGQVTAVSVLDRAGAPVAELFPGASPADSLAGWVLEYRPQGGAWAPLPGATVTADGVQFKLPAGLADGGYEVRVTPPPAPASAVRYEAWAEVSAPGWAAQLALTDGYSFAYGRQTDTTPTRPGSSDYEYTRDIAAVATPWPVQSGQLTAELTLTNYVNAGQVLEPVLVRRIDGAPAGSRLTVSGVWAEVQAADYLAPAGRARIGAEPWPAEPVYVRGDRIQAAVQAAGLGFNVGTGGSQGTLGPRDVDSKSPLELAQRAAAAAGRRIVAVAGGIGAGELLRMPTVLTLRDDVQAVLTEDPDIVTLPAGAIRRDRMAQDVAGMANQVKIDTRTAATADEPFGADGSVQLEDTQSIAAWGPMSLTITTDALDPEETGAAAQARRLINSRSAPSWVLAGQAAVLLSELPDTAGALADPYGIVGQLVKVPGAPDRLGQYQRVRSAQLTLGAEPALSLGLEPANYSAPSPVTGASLWAGIYGSQIKFRHMAGITANDLRTASND